MTKNKNKFTDTLLPWSPCDRENNDKKLIYSISNLRVTKQRPSSEQPIYSALRGPNANESLVFKIYRSQNLVKEIYRGYDVYNPNEPLYLYHGPRCCVEKVTEDENKTLIAESLFSPKRNYFDREYLTFLLDDEDIKWQTAEYMFKVYYDKEEYLEYYKHPKMLYVKPENK